MHKLTPESATRDRGHERDARVPLVVDLDGTLIRSDLLAESIVTLLKRSLHWIFLLPLWLIRGKACLKAEVARRTELDVSTLPYNQPFIEHLERERASGRLLFLATGAHESFARKLAERIGVFEDVLASTASRNLTAHEKLAALRERFGRKRFDYAGNDTADYPIWQAARRATVVNAAPHVTRWAEEHASVERVFPAARPGIRAYVRALRIHQWAKNLLLFVPLIAAHRFADIGTVLQLGVAFLAFSLCASSVYVLNDLVDVQDDRRHPRKRERPFASGALPLTQGFVLIPALLAGAAALTLFLPWQFAGVLAIYYATTLTYTFKVKQVEVLDVVTLAMLYTTRVFAGGAAAGIALSSWLLAFSVFIFLSLALAKRCAELAVMRETGKDKARGRGYRVADLPLLHSMGVGAGYIAALVMGLYVESPQVIVAYSNPMILWAFVPMLVYWSTRVWLKTFRGEMHDDPVVFAARDPVSMVLAVIGGAAIAFAI